MSEISTLVMLLNLAETRSSFVAIRTPGWRFLQLSSHMNCFLQENLALTEKKSQNSGLWCGGFFVCLLWFGVCFIFFFSRIRLPFCLLNLKFVCQRHY